MPPATPQKPEEPASPSVASDAPSPTPAATPPAPADSPNTVIAPAMPSALQPTDAPFNSLQPARDLWQWLWKGAVWLNAALAGMFLIFIVLRLMRFAGEGLSVIAVGMPFWLLPVLLIVDTLALGAFFFVKRPKMAEISRTALWVGISLAAVFVSAIVYVIVQSIS